MLCFWGGGRGIKDRGGEPLARQVKAAQGAGRYGAASRGGSPKSRRLFGCAPPSPRPFLRRGFYFSFTSPIYSSAAGLRPHQRHPTPPPEELQIYSPSSAAVSSPDPRLGSSRMGASSTAPCRRSQPQLPGLSPAAGGLRACPFSPLGRVQLKPKGKWGSPSPPHTASRWDFFPPPWSRQALVGSYPAHLVPSPSRQHRLVGRQTEPGGHRGRWLQ